jgi:hypothetical protein
VTTIPVPSTAELLTTTAETILAVARALPSTVHVVSVEAGGYSYRSTDLRVQVGDVAAAFATIQALSGVWTHDLLVSKPTEVLHEWQGMVNGARVQLCAFWRSADELDPLPGTFPAVA